jgi:nudix-type nucleoside diphosphatase (YffH/AdpP family)
VERDVDEEQAAGPHDDPRVRIRSAEVLSDAWFLLRRFRFDYRRDDGSWATLSRETYERGDGATVLLYDVTKRTVLLTRQFRFPVFVSGYCGGFLFETPAGFIGTGDPATEARREMLEETGHQIADMEHVFDVYLSPGSLTERLFCYATP